MKNQSTHAFFRLRLLVCLAFLMASGGFIYMAIAANPSSGTITPTSAPLTWQGTAPGVPPAVNGPAGCVEGQNCDSYTLTISGTPGDWVGKQVKVRITNTLPTTDYDLYIYKGGAQVAVDGRPPSTFEEITLDPTSSSIGTGEFVVRVVYFAVPPGDQYSGEISVIVGGIIPPLPAAEATGVAPRFQVHTPPAAGALTEGIDAAEPSVGVNWLTETGTNGGTAMYIALLETLRVTFDDSCPSSPTALWEDVSFVATTAITFDPILFTDHGYPGGTGTGRTLVSQLIFPAGSALSDSAYTEDDGATWLPSTGAGPGSGIDHQTIGGGGPYAAPAPSGVLYPNPIYYCGQLPAATCALSVDGGQSYGPAIAVDDPAEPECGGLHGHIKVGPDGTAYLPNKGCGSGQGVIVSEDNGLTWDVRAVPGSAAGGSDAAVGIGRGDEVKTPITNAPIGRVYLGYAHGDSKAAISTSDDRGLTWSTPVDVGAKFGINGVAFPAVVAGDDDRAAFAFYGTPTAGSVAGPKFSGIWHLYVAYTYDGGATWHTVDATPNDPMQRGCIWLGGGANICRNMLDFMGADLDARGRVLVGYNDGCAGAECSQATADAAGNSYTALSAIARQSGGKSLFAEHDSLFPDTAMVAGDPYVTARRNGSKAYVQWSPSNDGGSTITGFRLETAAAPTGPFSTVATLPANQLRYIGSVDPSESLVYYRVIALNAVGESCGNNAVPAPYNGDSSASTGFRIVDDPVGDQKNAPTDPDLDVQTLSIQEPATGPYAGKVVFLLKLGAVPSGNDKRWRVIWDSPNAVDFTQSPAVHVGTFYVGMVSDEAGQVSFDYGTVQTGVVGVVLGVPETRPVGTPDAGVIGTDGLVTIVVSKDKIGNVKVGDLMGNFSVRTYLTPGNNYIRTTDAIDITSNADANDLQANAFTYMVAGAQPGIASVVSRKTHGSAGTFDIDMPTAGPVGVENRNAGDNAHQIVIRFAEPVSAILSVSATPESGGTGSVSGFSINGDEVTVNLINVSNAQIININLTGVNLLGSLTDFTLPVGILQGDVNGSRIVTGADVNLVKGQQSQIATEGNFRTDVNASGIVTGADVNLTKSKQSTSL